MQQNNDFKTIAYIAGGIVLFPYIKSLLGLVKAGSDVTTGVLTTITPGALYQQNLNAAPSLYAELMKRPGLPLSTGQMPSLNRYLTDVECLRIADFIYDKLNAENYKWADIYNLFKNLSIYGIADLRMIYAFFGKRREWFWESPKDLFSFFKSDLNNAQLQQARYIFRPANIQPNL
jgi:hypothetical protein